jgi:hypothetical protein
LNLEVPNLVDKNAPENLAPRDSTSLSSQSSATPSSQADRLDSFPPLQKEYTIPLCKGSSWGTRLVIKDNEVITPKKEDEQYQRVSTIVPVAQQLSSQDV